MSKFTFLKEYRYNIVFLSLITLSLFINFYYFYYQLEESLIFSSTVMLCTFVNCLFFLLPYFIFRKPFFPYFILYLILIDILLIANVTYFKFYKNIIPLSSYSQIGNLSGLLGSLLSYLKLNDFFYVLNTILLIITYRVIFRKKLVPISGRKRTIGFILLLFFSILLYSGLFRIKEMKGEDVLKKFRVHSNPVHLVSNYGIIATWIYQITSYIADSKPLTDEEKKQIATFFKHQEKLSFVSGEEQKNLIVILVESLSTWVTRSGNGQATPFLNTLSQSDHCIFIPNVLPQTNYGRSSDGQLLINTGLTPVFNRTVVYAYPNQYYPSLAEALLTKNYYSLTIVGDRASIWNQQVMNITYHFDELISRNDLETDETIGLGISDQSVFRQSIPIFKRLSGQPFYTQIITLSSHDGIDFADRKSNVEFPSHYPEIMKNYIKSIEYVDMAIEYFFDELKKNDLLDNSIIVITGDHEGYEAKNVKKYAPELVSPLEDEKNTFIPLYIINSGRHYEQKELEVMGQVDIYPSLCDLMGTDKYFWQGVGKSIFSAHPPRFAVDKFLHVIGDTTAYKAEEIEYTIDAWNISDLLIRKKYIQHIKDNK